MAIYSESPKQQQNIEDQYSSLLQLLLKCSFLVIIISVINLVTYYSGFNIQIINYLEMTEITLLFLNQLPNYILLAIPVILLIFRKSALFSIFLSMCLFFVYLITSNTNIQAKWQFLVICIVSYLPVYVHFKRRATKDDPFDFFPESFEKYKSKLIVYLIVSSFVCTCINSWLNVRLVKNRHLYYGTQMVLGGKRIISDSAFYYVGQTKNYIFWYDASKRSPKVYPANKLEEITINTINVEQFFEAPADTLCDTSTKE